MADSKISALAAVTTVGDTDEYVVAVAGATKKITGANLKAAVAPVAGSYVTTAAEGGLSAEKVLGTTVIATGLLSARPAAAVAGYLYFATDVNGGTLYRDTGAAWVQVSVGVDHTLKNGQAGVVVPTDRGWNCAALAFSLNRVVASRFVLNRAMTVTNLSFRSVGAGTGNVDVGILSAAGARLASSGSTASKKGATTNQTVALSASVDLLAGTVYHAALMSDTADGTFLASLHAGGIEVLFGATIGLAEAYIKDSTFPMPDPVALGFSSTQGPVMVLT